MNRRCTLLLVIVGLGLAGVLVVVFWPRQSDQPLHFKIVRRAVEKGKPVVFFRVEGAGDRRIKIIDVEKVAGNTSEGPVFGSTALLGPRILVSNFWAESSPMPMFDLRKARRDFGVIAPSEAPIWRLRVTVCLETPSQFERLRMMPTMWMVLRSKLNTPPMKAAWETWGWFYGDTLQVVESDPITNSVALSRPTL